MPQTAAAKPIPALLGGAGRSTRPLSDQDRIAALEHEALLQREALLNFADALHWLKVGMLALQDTIDAVKNQSEALPGERDKPAPERKPH